MINAFFGSVFNVAKVLDFTVAYNIYIVPFWYCSIKYEPLGFDRTIEIRPQIHHIVHSLRFDV